MPLPTAAPTPERELPARGWGLSGSLRLILPGGPRGGAWGTESTDAFLSPGRQSTQHDAVSRGLWKAGAGPEVGLRHGYLCDFSRRHVPPEDQLLQAGNVYRAGQVG